MGWERCCRTHVDSSRWTLHHPGPSQSNGLAVEGAFAALALLQHCGWSLSHAPWWELKPRVELTRA